MSVSILKREDLARAIEELLAAGFQPPLYLAIISNKGEMGLAVWQRADVGALHIVASHTALGASVSAFTLPLNVLVVDQRGHAERLAFDLAADSPLH